MAARRGVFRWPLFGVLACFFLESQPLASQLIIFVENPGGEVLYENVTTFGQNMVISFEKRDTSQTTLWYDYANSVQAFKLSISGEEELNQAGLTRTLCYVVYFDRDSLVPVHAMYKLRQRNAHVLRYAEMDKDREKMYFDTKLATESLRELSPHMAELCLGVNGIYTRQKDVQAWTSFHGDNKVSRLKSTRVLLNPGQQVLCSSHPVPWAPCSCQLTTCIYWYPCALRICENNGVCGIRTCSKCYDMFHTEEGAVHCLE